MKFLEKVAEIDYLLLPESLHLRNLLPGFLLNHVVLHISALYREFECS